MPSPTINRLPKSLVEIKFIVSPDEAKPYLDQAVQDLQAHKPVPGFRPGKAPYEEVKKLFGEMRVWETALERIVRARYVHTVLEEKLDTIGSPNISVEQLVPGQDIKITVTATVMPAVLTMAEYDKPLVTREVREVKDTDIDHTLEDLRKMRRQEVASDKPATKDDMAVVNLEIKKNNVPVEGGVAQNYRIYLHEEHYIPGFSDQFIGLKKGDEKTFELEFPAEHYQKHLAGQKAQFTVKIQEVYELRLPELNDDFAKGVGLESLDKLKELLRGNLTREAEQIADEKAEIELIEKLVKGSKFSEIPELLLNEEVRRMYHELEHAAEEQGMRMEDYLQQLKKTADDIKFDFVPRAIERIQAAILIKEAAKREGVEISEEELDAETDRILEQVKPGDRETRERVTSPEYRDYMSAQMRNRKTIEALKKKAIKN